MSDVETKKIQVILPAELVDALDQLCNRAGRVSRTQALITGWPTLLEGLRARYGLDETP